MRPENISIAELSKHFDDGTVITLDSLKESKILSEKTNHLIITDGELLDKKFYVTANEFSDDAVKMLYMTGGQATLIKNDLETK